MNPLTPEQANTRIAEILPEWDYFNDSWQHLSTSGDKGCWCTDVLPNWYSDSNAFNRDCVPMLREKFGGVRIALDIRPDYVDCIIQLHDKNRNLYGTGPDIPASAALAFIEAMKDR